MPTPVLASFDEILDWPMTEADKAAQATVEVEQWGLGAEAEDNQRRALGALGLDLDSLPVAGQ